MQVDALRSQLANQQAQHEAELLKHVQVLAIKTGRVEQLERKLKDISYGPRPCDLGMCERGSVGRLAEALEGEGVAALEHGKNLLQFHISQASTPCVCVGCRAN